jgi:hypothetical protein
MHRATFQPTLPVLAFAACVACSGSTAAPAQQPDFAGTYATHVTLTQNDCGQINVQDNATVVTHNRSTSAVTFTHAGTTYTGAVQADSAFSTTPRVVDVGDGFQYTIAISGRFTRTGFDAAPTVDRSGGTSTACRFVVRWLGTR